MIFNSLHFLVFLPVILALFHMMANKWRWILLLLASYYFYAAWEASYLILIITSTLIDYFCALAIARYNHQKNIWLTISIASNIGLLSIFKYFNFFTDTINTTFIEWLSLEPLPYSDLLLPVGISFYTFQTLSYTIDVYRGAIEPEKHIGYFALYVTYFPQLVAGPIERSSKLLPQLKAHHKFNYEDFRYGLLQIASGFIKKVVIADRLAIIVDKVYENPIAYEFPSIFIAMVFFSFQVYCDFSGYSDIAIGVASLFGVRLTENFKQPYLSVNFRKLIRRWHITLTSWFMDYVYIPLGGNNRSAYRTILNGILVFAISGLWHGAQWTFVIWGITLGLIIAIERLLEPYWERVIRLTRTNINSIGYRFFMAVWIFTLWALTSHLFRSATIDQAFESYIKISSIDILKFISVDIPSLGLDSFEFMISVALILSVVAIQYAGGKKVIIPGIFRQNLLIRWTLYFVIGLVLFYLGVYNNQAPEFIYFQF